MRIAVLGRGNVGGALAATWSEQGHDVAVSTRETIAETVDGRDVVVLAVPAAAAPDVLAQAGSLEGRILVDATNNLSGGPDGLAIAALAPGAKVVKAFNTVFATFMHDTPPERPASLVISGDDAQAKETIGELVRAAGFEPVDLGGSEQTPLVEALAQLVIGLAYRQTLGPLVYRLSSR
jgi:predicted dinucleotide-binding enzyme